MVKLGGSLSASPLRARWIEALRRYPHKMSLVPGGGPFADAVRSAQPRMGFSTASAHGMALLAMEQYALALADLHDGFVLFESLDELPRIHARRKIALWRPFAMVRAASDIPPSWDVTSDSLAAWLAHAAGASALLLVKSVDASPGADIVSLGIVDPAFSSFSGQAPIYIAGPRALGGAQEILAADGVPGVRIDFVPSKEKIAS